MDVPVVTSVKTRAARAHELVPDPGGQAKPPVFVGLIEDHD